jgi:hypothetical protein
MISETSSPSKANAIDNKPVNSSAKKQVITCSLVEKNWAQNEQVVIEQTPIKTKQQPQVISASGTKPANIDTSV